MIDIERSRRQIRKNLQIWKGGLRPTAILGRYGAAKVLINSVPKAGTNLLQELVLQLPYMRGRIAKTYSLWPGKEDELCEKIKAIKDGQCVGGHITYDKRVADQLAECGVKNILIIRDFRDVILSNIRYLEKIHRNHPHNEVFAKLETLDRKIDACIVGVPEVNVRPWPELVHAYRGWLSTPDILVIRYEDLVSPDTRKSEYWINKIALHLEIHSGFEASAIRKSMFNPDGLTYNAPGIAKWKTAFNQSQIDRLTNAFAEELEFFGYSLR